MPQLLGYRRDFVRIKWDGILHAWFMLSLPYMSAFIIAVDILLSLDGRQSGLIE